MFLVDGGRCSVSDNIQYTFLARDVVRLTGLSMSQLTRWDREGFFAPRYADDNRKSAYSRIYSFKDVVGLRTISELKGRHGVPFRELRRVAKELSSYTKTPWSDIRLWVWNRIVHFNEPETGRDREVVGGQYVLFPLEAVERDVINSIAELRKRRETDFGHLEQHRLVARNALVVAGTRIPVSAIKNFSGAGFSPEQIMQEYPALTREDIEAALAADPDRKAA